MKGAFRKILTVAAALLTVLSALLFASCKSIEPRSEADVIPDALGESEGLWLYCGNTRSLTDGTMEGTLLASVTVDGAQYGEEEFQIITYRYVRATCEIFYVLLIGGQYRAYHYNYSTKASSDLCALPPAERIYDYQISVSSSLVYILNTRTGDGVICSPEAQILYEDFPDGTLDGDIVYRISSYDFIYFKDGEFHQIPLNTSYHSSAYHRYGNYVYFFGDAACGFDLTTKELFPLTAINESGNRVSYPDIYCADGTFYFMAVNYVSRFDGEAEHLTSLYRVSGKTAQLVYEFGDAPRGMRMGIEGNEFYITQYGPRERQSKYFVYHTDTGEMKRSSKSQSGRGTTPEDLQKAEDAAKKAQNLKAELSVGEYVFYVTSIDYDDQPGMFGRHYTKTCYYLMRDSGGKSEILQYSLNGNGGRFYDDIREF